MAIIDSHKNGPDNNKGLLFRPLSNLREICPQKKSAGRQGEDIASKMDILQIFSFFEQRSKPISTSADFCGDTRIEQNAPIAMKRS